VRLGAIAFTRMIPQLTHWHPSRYYPSVASPLSDKPYGPRVPREDQDETEVSRGLRTDESTNGDGPGLPMVSNVAGSQAQRQGVAGDAGKTVPTEHGYEVGGGRV
jgi:hypothetical protein